jgi:hypothetical protein
MCNELNAQVQKQQGLPVRHLNIVQNQLKVNSIISCAGCTDYSRTFTAEET